MPISIVLSANSDRRLVLSHYVPGEECRPHRHVGPQLSLLLAGGYSETSEEGRVDVERPILSAKPSGFEHQNTFGESGALILSAQGAISTFGLVRYNLAACSSRRSSETLLNGVIAGDPAFVGGAACTPSVNDDVTSITPWLRKARRRLVDDPEQSISSLAQSMGRHPVHLTRVFRAAFGRSPSVLRRDHRVARAIDWIVRTDLPLAEVACGEGFSDQAHMTRTVHQAIGWTPGGLRRAFAGSAAV